MEVAGVPCCQGGGHMACTVMAALTPGGLTGSWRQCAEALLPPPSFLQTSPPQVILVPTASWQLTFSSPEKSREGRLSSVTSDPMTRSL